MTSVPKKPSRFVWEWEDIRVISRGEPLTEEEEDFLRGLEKSEHKDWAYEQWKAIDALATLWESKFANVADGRFKDELRELLAVLSEAKQKSLKEKATVNWQWVGDKWKEVLQQAKDLWREAFIPLVKGVIESQGQRWSAELGMRFDVRKMPAEQWLRDYTLVFAQPINDTTSKAISIMLEQAMEEGWTIPQMQDNLETMFKQWMTGSLSKDEFQWYKDRLPAHRTEMIARTETMRASNAGTMGIFKEWGVKKKEWLGTNDLRIRESHQEAWAAYSRGGNPGPIPIDKPFHVGRDELMFPGDPDGSPGETINCRCTVLPVIEDEKKLEEE